jgi:hypothetical protein
MPAFIERNQQNTASDDCKVKGQMDMKYSLSSSFLCSFPFFSSLSPVLGSCTEVETQILLCKDLCYLSANNFTVLNNLLTEVGKMLYALITKIKENKARKGSGRKQ